MGAENSVISKVQGFQVGRVLPNSPAHICGLCPFFDIITGVDDIALDMDSIDFFKDYVTRNANSAIRLTIFSLRLRVYRVVTITPSDSWGGVGLLGCAMEWSSAAAALELTWHIEAIHPNGPAARCEDLAAERDYIIGMQAPDEPVVTLFTHSTFAEKMEGWRSVRRANAEMDPTERDTLILLVFDSEANTVKEVPVFMGNSTSLGIEIADGYLHFVPAITISDPAEVPSKLPYVSKFIVSGVARTVESLAERRVGEDTDALNHNDTNGHVLAQEDASRSSQAHEEQSAHDLETAGNVELEAERAAPPVAPAPLPVPQLPPAPASQAPGSRAAPSFPSFLPQPHGSHPVAPSGLPFPSFPVPPAVRPPTQAPTVE